MFEWKRATPGQSVIDDMTIQYLQDELAKHNTRGFLIVKNDLITWEWYAPGRDKTTRHFTASLAKALVGGTSLLVAMSDGLIGPDDPVCKYIETWQRDPHRSKITVRHLATHTSGIEDAEVEGKSHEELTGWKGSFWSQEENPFRLSIDMAPVLFEPGTRYAYSNPGMAVLAAVVTAGLRDAGAPHIDTRSLLRERIMRPLGISESEWSVGYGKTFGTDGLPLVANWGGGSFTARTVARIGRLMLRRGDWDGRQILHPDVVDQAVHPSETTAKPSRDSDLVPASGLCWYTNEDGVWPDLPRDAFAGAGAQHQVLLVIPSLELVVVRNGGPLAVGPFWTKLVKHLFVPVVEAISG